MELDNRICALDLIHKKLLVQIGNSVLKELQYESFGYIPYWRYMYKEYIKYVDDVCIIQSPLRECINVNCVHYLILPYNVYFKCSDIEIENAYEIYKNNAIAAMLNKQFQENPY